MTSKRVVSVLACLLCAAAHAQSVEVAPELWDRPRTARALLDHDSVKRAVLAALATPESQLVIHHAPGPDASLQAEELKSWLAALAIDSRRIDVRSGGTPGAALRFVIVI